MNVLLAQPPVFPHQHENPRLSPSRGMSPLSNMASKSNKRQREDDGDEMSVSPQSSPSLAQRQLARPRKMRRVPEPQARSLPLPRLLETLDNNQLRTVLQTICDQRPDIQEQVLSGAPRPTAANSLQVLESYQQKLVEAMPLGHSSSDYAYYRVKHHLGALVDAIMDFTPQYLPPAEDQASISLMYLDGVTKIAHSLPNWDSQTYRHHKDHVYDEIAKAWTMVISEAAKRGGGFTLHREGWDQLLAKHNEQAGGRLQPAVNTLANHVGWTSADQHATAGGSSGQDSILDQLLNGSYGSAVRVGPF
ncbi:Cut8-domain-containing protein [Cryphonectria parasitica EP155]|uniref:Tethering factor for nuclear proteasome STS1 n=1 Tax=Cryphonectria parasitica (strain ATCC 38755 / EP155) TaxID=660469 RepID=A0A9P4XTD9_CRYP1|nr:Cut8-domain-containing protein [Cryphonectria parasitica EP155]KAF3760568.1 Cut8-domain-containing protein [Cryphonectria parasitica EP155]